MSEELCTHCGAPRVAGYAACKFCKTPFTTAAEAAQGTGGIPCPRCNTLNEMSAQRCVQCQSWVVVQCVFCHAISPHNVPACVKCGEAFAGAPQRFAERQSQQRLQQGLNVAGTVGNVAASFLGAAVAAGAFSGRSHQEHYGYHEHHSHHHHRDDDDWNRSAGLSQSNEGSSGGSFLGSLFGSSDSSSSDEGAGLSVESDSDNSGGGLFDSVFGGSSDSSSSDDSDDSGAGLSIGDDDGGDDS